MTQEAQILPPIEDVFRPNSTEYCNNPVPQCLALAEAWSSGLVCPLAGMDHDPHGRHHGLLETRIPVVGFV